MRRVFLRTVLLLSAYCSAAVAQSAGVAEALFRDGLKLFAAGETPAACEKFAESFRLDPANGTLQNLAACHEKDGKVASSWSEWSLLAGRAAEAKQQAREALARRKAAELEPRLFRLRLSVHAGIEAVAVDGKELTRSAWSTELPLDPGPHVVTFRAPGFRPKTVDLVAARAGGRSELTAPTLEAEPIERHDPPALLAPPPPEHDSRSGTLRLASYVTMGVGGAGVAVGAVLGALALGAKSDLSSHCEGKQCDAEGLSANDRAQGLAAGSTVAFVAGGVLVGAGVTMFLLSAPRTPSGSAVAVGLGASGLGLRGTF